MPPLDEAAAEEVDAGKMEEVDWVLEPVAYIIGFTL
jgi:hypothetical protein